MSVEFTRPLAFIFPNGSDLAFLQVLFSSVFDLDENVGHFISSGQAERLEG